MIYNQTRQRYYALENASAADNYGKVILAADFKAAIADLEQTGVIGELAIFVSDQYDAPVINGVAPEGPNNDFHEVGYSDMNGIRYNPGFRFNPATSTPGGNQRFNIETTGARWICLCILNLTAGTVDKLSLNLYDNQ